MPHQKSLRREKLDFENSHAVVIGIDWYPDIDNHLSSAVNDATKIAGLLKENQGFDRVLLLLDPTKAELQALIEWLGNSSRPATLNLSPAPAADSGEPAFASRSRRGWLEAGPGEDEEPALVPLADKAWAINPDKDSILFYYAGHGIPGDPDRGPAGYIVPSDAAGGVGDYRNLLPMDELYAALKALNSLHTLLILDCCFAGKFRFSHSTRFMIGTEVPHLYKERFLQYTSSRAWQVLTSSGPDQEANDTFSLLGERSENSPFAASLIEALQGEADLQQEGVITAVELYLSVRQKVRELQKQQIAGGKPQHPGLFPMEDHRGGEFIFLNPAFDFSKLEPRPLNNPYKGLYPYEPEDREWFYGRENATAEAVGKLENFPVLIISGPSAAGKSSLAKAGVFAALREQHGFELLTLRPNAKPWTGQPVNIRRSPDDTGEELLHYHTGLRELCLSQAPGTVGPEAGIQTICALLDPTRSNKKRLLLIDQYEELFTECDRPEELKDFETALEELFTMAGGSQLDHPEKGSLRIVLTLRSDFEWQLEASAFGKKLLQDGGVYYNLFRLHPMGLEELRAALTGPAHEEVFEFEDKLVEQILEDLNYAPAALPLLSFAMHQFFELTMEKGARDDRGEPRRIFTDNLYADEKEGLGGIVGALRRKAEEIYASLGDAQTETAPGKDTGKAKTPLKESLQQETLRKIFLRLIRPGEGQATRRRVYQPAGDGTGFWSELDYPNDEEDALVAEVLENLEDAQLVVRGRDLGYNQNYVEIAHDSLINCWPRALQWVKDFGQDNLVLQRQLWQAALEHKKHNSGVVERQASPSYGPVKSRSANAQVSTLWENSPKLLQAINLLWDPNCAINKQENGEVLQTTIAFLEQKLDETQIPYARRVLSGWLIDHGMLGPETARRLEEVDFSVPEQVLHLLLYQGRHWFNKLETDFIWESWQKRQDRINRLIEERNRANYSLAKLYEERSGEALDRRNLPEAWLYNLAALNMETGTASLPVAAGRLLLPGIRPGKTTYRSGQEKTDQAIWCMDTNAEKRLYALGCAGFKIELRDQRDHSKILELAFDVENHEPVFKNSATRAGSVDIIWDLAIHPSGEQLAFCVSSNADTTMQVRGRKEFRPVYEFLYICHLTEGGRPRTESIYTGVRINCLSYDETGDALFVCSDDANFVFLTRSNYKDFDKYRNSPSPISALQFIDGALITGHRDGSVNMQPMHQGRQHGEIVSLEAHQSEVTSISCLRKERLIATGERDKKIAVWRIGEKEISKENEWEAHPGSISGLGFTDNSRLLWSTSGNTLRLWDWQNGTPAAQVNTRGTINEVVFNPLDRSLYLGAIDKKIHEVNLNIHAFGEGIESPPLDEFILAPRKAEHQDFLRELDDWSKRQFPSHFEGAVLRIDDFKKMQEARRRFFGEPGEEAELFSFKNSNTEVFGNDKAREAGYPEMEGHSVTVTPGVTSGAAGAVFLQTEIIPPFSVEFEYAIRYRTTMKGKFSSSEDGPAHGLVLLLFKDPDSYKENPIPGGRSRGFIADGKGHGVHFATHEEKNIFLTNGLGVPLADAGDALEHIRQNPLYSDGEWRKVAVIVEESKISVWYAGRYVIRWEGPIEHTYRSLGFSAANGASHCEHTIRNVAISKL